jgi:cell division septation protein DedD
VVSAIVPVLSLVYGKHYSETCFLPIDLMILQDTTGSFDDDLPNVSKNIPVIVERVLEQNPGSWFGATEFKDKPYRDLGEPNDFCYRLSSKMTPDVEEFQEAYDKLYASGGGDLPEAQLHALINVVSDPAVGWRAINNHLKEPSDQFAAARMIVVSTDAVPHDPLDYEMYHEDPLPEDPRPPMFMPAFPDSLDSISISDQCRIYDYPSMEQAAAVIKGTDAQIVFLVPQTETAAVEKWKLFNEVYLGQPSSFLQFISSDSSNIVEVILQAVSEVSNYICFGTTTPAPVTTAGAPETTTPAPAPTTTPAPAPTTTPAPAPTTTQAPAPTTTPAPAPTTTPAPAPTRECVCEGQDECQCAPALVVNVNHRPKKLIIDYTK